MFDYIIHLYVTHTIIFYIFLVVLVIIEWPITILTISLLAPKIGINFIEIFILAFIWDFVWDLLYYFAWKFSKNKIIKKDFKVIKKIEDKLKKKSLLDEMIIIKYTPPITSIGLFYLWYINTNLQKFLKNWFFLSTFSAVIVTSIGYNFWYLFKDNNNFLLFITFIFISFVVFYFLFRKLTNFIIKKIYE